MGVGAQVIFSSPSEPHPWSKLMKLEALIRTGSVLAIAYAWVYVECWIIDRRQHKSEQRLRDLQDLNRSGGIKARGTGLRGAIETRSRNGTSKDSATMMKLSIAVAGLLVLAFTWCAVKMDLKGMAYEFFTGEGKIARIIALGLVLANAKNLPFGWHVRTLRVVIRQLLLARHTFDPLATSATELGPASLFQPSITTTHSPLYECDYNLHKSNSTYFSDLDIARCELTTILIRTALMKLQDRTDKGEKIYAPNGKEAKGTWMLMLGSVQCNYRREVAMFESYEIWSRVLCWDRKWIYVVSHFVRAGTVKPDGFTVQKGGGLSSKLFAGAKLRDDIKRGAEAALDEKNASAAEAGVFSNEMDFDADSPNPAIFASAISKYVVKLGRLTIHPEVIFSMSGLLPPKPGGWATMSPPRSPKGSLEVIIEEDVNEDNQSSGASSQFTSGPTTPTGGMDSGEWVDASLNAISNNVWDWRRVMAEKERGLKYANSLGVLDELFKEFTGDKRPALGMY